MRSDFWIQKMQINCDLSQWPLRNQCARQAGLVCSKCRDRCFHTGQQGCLQRRLARRKPQPAATSTHPSASSPVPLLPATGDEHDPDNKQLEACQRTIHPWSTMPSLINFLIKNCHAGMRYKEGRLGISHKTASLNPEVVENLCSYGCLWVFLAQRENQFACAWPSRRIKFILKETGFWKALARMH